MASAGDAQVPITLTDNERAVMKIFAKNRTKFIYNREIAEKLDWPIRKAYLTITKLYEYGCLKRTQGTGHSFKYIFHSMKPNQVVLHRAKLTLPEVETMQINRQSIESLVKPWAQGRWEPKIFISSGALPNGLATLYELAVEARMGSKINQEYLNEIKQSIMQFANDLRTTSTVVESILQTVELWDAKDFFQYLLADDFDPEYYAQMAADVKDHNS